MTTIARKTLAAKIAARFPTPEAVLPRLLANQWHAEDTLRHEFGIATRVFSADNAYSVWVFQSEAHPTPGLVPTWRIVLSGHCQTIAEAEEAAVDAGDAEYYAGVLGRLPDDADGSSLF